ncbi:DUF2321 domain-containing protein [Lysinibacillus sphaericus]|uniref:DUF2321 domain-containing protein n=1 Tax=Lysinibacillus sphaericus TaxID=1421 RepID=UPI000567986F|nr:DUF2321 domain-containing protein [Lysinibacillus sphaericus]
MSSYYENATICLNGHVISSYKANSTKHCDICGEKTVSYCETCTNPIRGEYTHTDIIVLGGDYTKPAYCHECGSPFPWTTRVLDHAIEILSLDEELSPEHKELVKLALPDLLVEKPTTPVAVAKYRKVIPKAATYVQDGLKNILVDVVSETVKKSIWG